MRIICLFLLLSNVCYSQIKSATLGIDGLTCSMCSLGVENGIKQLEFVSSVSMDLNENIATITFKPATPIDFYKISAKIKDAGFSVRFTKANGSVDDFTINEKNIVKMGNQEMKVINYSSQDLKQSVKFTLVGKEFMSRTSYRNYLKAVPGLAGFDKNIYSIIFEK